MDALRGGEYPKTKGVLCRTDGMGTAVGFCCLGVLADIAYEEPWVEVGSKLGVDFRGTLGKIETAVLPSQNLPFHPRHLNPLIDLNDDHIDFGPVIDYIEEEM